MFPVESPSLRILFCLTIACSVGLLSLDVTPGNWNGWAICCVVFFAVVRYVILKPLIAIGGLALLGVTLAYALSPSIRRRWRQRIRQWSAACVNRRPPVHWCRWAMLSAVVASVTTLLLWFHVPQLVVFAILAPTLRDMANDAPVGDSHGYQAVRKVGPYAVERVSADERGGVFFRTGTGPDGIGPDLMSHGFAIRPNGRGTPFGNARYVQRHLFGEWYTFAASNDW